MAAEWCWYKNREAIYLWRVQVPSMDKKSDWARARFGFDFTKFMMQQSIGGVCVVPFTDIAKMKFKKNLFGYGGRLTITTDDGTVHELRDRDLMNLNQTYRMFLPHIEKARNGISDS